MSDGPVIVISGFMATGKSETGRALADALGLDFVDTDDMIAEEAGMSIADIFARHGEPYFRELEAKLAARLKDRRGVVIATGGGMLMNDAIFWGLSKSGQLVLLEASLDKLRERIEGDTSRPVALKDGQPLDGEALMEHLETVLASRAQAYERITFRVDTSERTPTQTAGAIAARLAIEPHHLSVDPPLQTDKAVGRFGTSHVEIGRGSISTLGRRLQEIGIDQHAFVLTPDNLRATFESQLSESLAGGDIPYTFVSVDDGDRHKTMAQASDLIDRLIDAGAKRDATVIPVGGGVTGDIGGFVASVYMRGVPLVQIPTTLLAQVDSSVGGKVGVNHTRAKNLIGSFYQPHLVLGDPCSLRTLPLDEISNGMAEVIKSALIGSESFFDYIEERTATDASQVLRDATFLERCVTESVAIKVGIVNADPYEKGLRRTLNLGHTVGHAVEATAGYDVLKHGQAVSLGMVAAYRIAAARKLVDANLVDRVLNMLQWAGLPVSFGDIDLDAIRKAVQLDKKFQAGKLHFVMPTGIARVEVVDDVTFDEIAANIGESK